MPSRLRFWSSESTRRPTNGSAPSTGLLLRAADNARGDASPQPPSSSTPDLKNKPYGFFQLANDPNTPTTVDVIAVHGLGGHPYETWTHENGNLWLRDSLPQDTPFARILTFGYDSHVVTRSVATIETVALQLLTSLRIKRENDNAVETNRPIVFVCHSLGGIVVKKALVLAHERSSNSGFQDILWNTRAIAFLGVPHEGSRFADFGHTLASALKVATMGTSANNALLAGLKKDASLLYNISNQFVDRGKDLKIYTFFELEKVAGTPHRVVDERSARIGLPKEDLIPINADHRSICKWESCESPLHENVGLAVARLVREAVEISDQTKLLEQQRLEAQKSLPKGKKYFRLPSSGSQFFTGRESEIGEMRDFLKAADTIDQRRLVIWGVSGAGKTQLALHYALRYREEFSAVFYLNAQDASAFRRDCLGVAKSLKLPEAVNDSNDSPTGLDQDDVVGAVQEWLTNHERGDWLLIVDNANNLGEFNPMNHLPAINKGQVIFTSQSQNSFGLGGAAIELGGMQAEDAQRLFIKRCGLRNVTDEQRDIAMEVVTRLGFLALPVEHAAAYVQSTGMLLHEYLETFQQTIQPYLSASHASLHEQSIQASVNMTWNALRTRNAIAAELLAFIAHLHNGGIEESHFSSPVTETMFRNWKCHSNRAEYLFAIEVMHSFSLVQSTQVGDDKVIVSMHASIRHSIRAIFTLESTWLLLLRATTFLYKIAERQPPSASLFPHIRDVLCTADELFNKPTRGEPNNALWQLLAPQITQYRMFWGAIGCAHELERVATTVMQALSLEESDNNRIMRISAMVGRVSGAHYTKSSSSMAAALLDVMLQELTPAAAAFLQEAHATGGRQASHSAFKPYSLADVLKHQTPVVYVDLMILIWKITAPSLISQDENKHLGFAYLRLSQLPRSESWITQGRRLLGIAVPLLGPIDANESPNDEASRILIAQRDREQGNMESTISLLQFIIDANKDPAGEIRARGATYDLARILYSLGRKHELAELIKTLKHADEQTTEANIAKQYQDFYIWARKAQSWTMASHDQHDTLETMLKETYETAKNVFGALNIYTFHSQFLLEEFYLRPCCSSPETATRIRNEIEAGFAQLYGGWARIRIGEAIFMGRLLMAQGAVQEALEVFETFEKLAQSRLGPDFALTQSAKRWAATARRERDIELRNEKAGKATWKFGCCTYQRDFKSLSADSEV